jgi:hypothetical protein
LLRNIEGRQRNYYGSGKATLPSVCVVETHVAGNNITITILSVAQKYFCGKFSCRLLLSGP